MTTEDKIDAIIDMLNDFSIKTQENFDNINRSFDKINQHFDNIEKRSFESKHDQASFESQLLHLEKSIYDHDQQQVERHVFYLEQFKRIESRISALESNAA